MGRGVQVCVCSAALLCTVSSLIALSPISSCSYTVPTGKPKVSSLPPAFTPTLNQRELPPAQQLLLPPLHSINMEHNSCSEVDYRNPQTTAAFAKPPAPVRAENAEDKSSQGLPLCLSTTHSSLPQKAKLHSLPSLLEEACPASCHTPSSEIWALDYFSPRRPPHPLLQHHRWLSIPLCPAPLLPLQLFKCPSHSPACCALPLLLLHMALS